MRLICRALRWIINLVFVCLLLGLALMLAAPRLWGLDFRAVASGSMEPTIPLGALVAVQPVDASTVQPGDVITFRSLESPGLVVTHRVVEVTGSPDSRAFRTKGDANDDVDMALVPAANVLGQALFRVPYAGYMAQFVRTRQGWLLLVVVPAVILVLMELINILKVIWSSDKQPFKDSEAAKEPV